MKGATTNCIGQVEWTLPLGNDESQIILNMTALAHQGSMKGYNGMTYHGISEEERSNLKPLQTKNNISAYPLQVVLDICKRRTSAIVDRLTATGTPADGTEQRNIIAQKAASKHNFARAVLHSFTQKPTPFSPSTTIPGTQIAWPSRSKTDGDTSMGGTEDTIDLGAMLDPGPQ